MANKKVWNANIAAGMCASCGKVPPVENRRECITCKTKRSESQKKNYTSGSKRDKLKTDREERKLQGVCYRCGKVPPATSKMSCSNCLAKTCDRIQRYKDMCYAKYGGYKCSCCGETTKQFLVLDHINDDGAKHRKSLNRNHIPYQWIIDNNYPPIFQVLCANCNMGKQMNGGRCPHQDSPGYRGDKNP